MPWKYHREESTYDEIPEGTYRIRIEDAETAISKSGNDMLVLKYEVNGYSSRLWHYIVFLDNNPQFTNRMLTQFFDSFGIKEGEFDMSTYIGKVGACKVKHDEDGRAKVSYLISKNKQDNLPPWKALSNSNVKEADVEIEDLPF